MVYAYIRVSTGNQTTDNQRVEISQYCKNRNIHVDKWIDETITGTKSIEKRKLGKEIIANVKENDLVICTEISRLGRNLVMIMNVLQIFLEKGVKVITIKDGYNLADNITSKVIAFAFGLASEIERQLISERTKMALKRVKMEGKKLGRPVGRKSSVLKLSGKEDFIRWSLLKGEKKSVIAKKLGVSRNTIYRFIKERIVLL
ncbi:MAG: recombinase family protein [Treponema sp.]|nr:recombinase family protein [Treponema sp.]